MFWPDVLALKEFYTTPLGQTAYRAILKRIMRFWPGLHGDRLLGMGFTPPYLHLYAEESASVICCMPATQGVIHWPTTKSNKCFLTDETDLPLADNSIERVLLIHALENTEHPHQMMAEISRVLTPTGKLCVVVPNRHGLWAYASQSPFAHGQPLTVWQLKQWVVEHSFTPIHTSAALFFPPALGKRPRLAGFLETLGHRFFPAFGGVLIMEAEKRIYAPTDRRIKTFAPQRYAPAMRSVGSIS